MIFPSSVGTALFSDNRLTFRVVADTIILVMVALVVDYS